jgi:hypothetical protein
LKYPVINAPGLNTPRNLSTSPERHASINAVIVSRGLENFTVVFMLVTISMPWIYP